MCQLNNPMDGVQLTTERTLQAGVTVNQILTSWLARRTVMGCEGFGFFFVVVASFSFVRNKMLNKMQIMQCFFVHRDPVAHRDPKDHVDRAESRSVACLSFN